MSIAGFTSTGSKRPAALFGNAAGDDLALRMTRSAGAKVWDADGREYLDFIMALGAVTLGYGHPAIMAAARDAIERGGVGPLAPVDEAELATSLRHSMPWLESVRFLKTGAEAVAAAVRLARVATGRERILGCGYHGWLDLSNESPGVPAAVRALYQAVPFNDAERWRSAIRKAGDELAAVVVEPVVDGAPSREWLECLEVEVRRVGAVLVFDEIKTGFRVAVGGAAERWGGGVVVPDLVVLGKALANGFPLAAVGGRAELLDQVERTWISSTLATELVSLAAARAAVDYCANSRVPDRLRSLGQRLFDGLGGIAARRPDLVTARGIPEMCYLGFAREELGAEVASECARRGLLFKRNAYNFVSFAHDEAQVDHCLGVVGEVVAVVAGRPRRQP